MSEEGKVNGSVASAHNVAVVTQTTRAALLAQADLMLRLGVPLNIVFDGFLDVACNLISAVEPQPVREMIVKHMLANLPLAIGKHYDARHTRPSGIIVPPKTA
jgi:hypothetical protein